MTINQMNFQIITWKSKAFVVQFFKQPILLLMRSVEKLHCRKVPFVLRYLVPNKHKDPEQVDSSFIVFSLSIPG